MSQARTAPTRRRRHKPRALVDRIVSPAVGWLHCSPDFIIIGAARSGTTAVLNYLRKHPGVLECPTDELHFFDSNRFKVGMSWYRRQFPLSLDRRRARLSGVRPAITGENSPFYLAYEKAPARVRAALPDVRLIALLRDPTDRAISHWNWRVNRKHETRSFEEAARTELELLRGGAPTGGWDQEYDVDELSDDDEADVDEDPGMAGPEPGRRRRDRRRARLGSDASRPGTYKRERFEMYISRGLYLEQLKRWHATFRGDQLLVLISERFYEDPGAEMARVWEHLGLEPMARLPPIPRNANKRRLTVDPAVADEVRAFCRPYNAELASYLGVELPWR